MDKTKKLPVNEKLEAYKKAQLLLQEAEQERVTEALKDFNEFRKAWSEKHGYDIVAAGQFQGNQIATSIQLVKIK